MFFQHDGALTHWSRRVRYHLDLTFPDRWIGRGGPVSWGPRSPDLSSLDFFYIGILEKRCILKNIHNKRESDGTYNSCLP